MRTPFAKKITAGIRNIARLLFADNSKQSGGQIALNYQLLQESQKKLALEHEKLLMHIQSSADGICFFTSDWKLLSYNGLFLRYMNLLLESFTLDFSEIMKNELFSEIVKFIKNPPDKYFETTLLRHGRHFVARVNMFDDGSFEIVLNDRTQQAVNRQLKQELTGNIAHELRTPITGIRGYLETILTNNLPRDKEYEFVNKAYEQVIALSEMIRDMSLLARISESPNSFQLKPLKIKEIIKKVQGDLTDTLISKRIAVNCTVLLETEVLGNENLLYAVFRNLMDNTLRYAGEAVEIEISQTSEQEGMLWFSFADNGVGIADEQHLLRLFECFYRVEEGRSCDSGGSGLGLSIVKNVISFHRGTVSVRNRTGGGLEFLFNLIKHI